MDGIRSSLENLDGLFLASNVDLEAVEGVSSDGEVGLAIGGLLNGVVALLERFTKVAVSALAATLTAPVLIILIDDSRCLDGSVDGKAGSQASGACIELLSGKLALSIHQIGAGQSLGLPVLEGSISVVEALRASASRCGQVSIVFELPVSPANKILIGDITNLVDFLSAGTLSKACTKLSDVVRDTKALGIEVASANTLLVPDEALVCESRIGLSSSARRWIATELAAVGMVVEDVVSRADLTTGRSAEPNRVDSASVSPAINIRICDRFEPHKSLLIILDIFVKDGSVGGSQMLAVHDTRDTERWVLDVVAGEGLVERIKSDNIGVLGEAGRGGIPVSNELIVEVVHVVEEGTKAGHRLFGVVIIGKHLLEAILNKIIIVLIAAVVEIVHVIALAERGVVVLQKFICDRVDARGVLSDGLLSIEVRDTLTAHEAGKHILMGIDESVDTGFTHLVNEGLNLVKVVGIILAFGALNTFPHNAKANKVHAPLLQVGNILIVKRVVRVKLTLRRDVRINLVDSVDTMEQCGAAIFVNKETRLCVNLQRIRRLASVREASAIVLGLVEGRSFPRVVVLLSLAHQVHGLVDTERICEGVLITIGTSDPVVEFLLLFKSQFDLSRGNRGHEGKCKASHLSIFNTI